MSPSPSGSWWKATQTGPSSRLSRVARSFAQASPAPAAICSQEWGSLKLIHGSRPAARSAVALRTAELTPLPV